MPADVIKYLSALQEMGMQKSSLRRKRVAIKQFFDFLLENDQVLMLDFDLVPAITTENYLPDTISVEEMKKLLDGLPMGNNLEYRNKANWNKTQAGEPCGTTS